MKLPTKFKTIPNVNTVTSFLFLPWSSSSDANGDFRRQSMTLKTALKRSRKNIDQFKTTYNYITRIEIFYSNLAFTGVNFLTSSFPNVFNRLKVYFY